MGCKRILLFLTLAICGHTVRLLASEQQTIELQIGESHLLSLPGVEQITLSRKGILHAKKIEEDKWMLIGLKIGYTLLQAESASEHFFIGVFVGKRAEASDLFQTEDSDDTGSLEDQKVKSTPKSRQQAMLILDDYFPKPYFRQELVGDEIHLQTPCMNSLAKSYRQLFQKLSKSLSQQAKIQFYCLPPTAGNYSIEIFLTHLQSGDGQSYDGLRLQKNIEELQVRYDPLKFTPEFNHQENQDSLLSYPKLIFRLGAETKFSSGGELESTQMLQNKEQTWSQSHWKRFGLDFKFEAAKLFDGQIILNYEATLNVPSSMEGRLTVQGSNSQSQILLEEGQVSLAGIFDIISGSSLNRRQGFLANFPIIGPLFWQDNTSFKSSTIAIFVRIAKT